MQDPNFYTEGRVFPNYTLFEFTTSLCIHITCIFFLFVFISKGLAMCRLGGGGVISTQIVLFEPFLL